MTAMCLRDVRARATTNPNKRKQRSHEEQSSSPLTSSRQTIRVHTLRMLPRCFLVIILSTLVLTTNGQNSEETEASDQTYIPQTSIQQSDKQLAIIDYSFDKENRSLSNPVLVRKRRYVRFPAGSAHNGRYAFPNRPDAGFYPEWTPVASHQGPYYHRPMPAAVMGQRSPRLVFRDQVSDVPGSAPGVGFFHPNGIHEQPPAEDGRDYRRPSGRYPFLGDQNMCSTGTCEFFLSCWMSSGLIEGGCGGFMFACCQRTAGNTAKTSDFHGSVSNNVESTQLLQDYGPVVNDPRCGVSIGKIGPSLGAQRRIVGGDEAGFGSFPWQAYIRIGSSRCGGSLVNRFHVVTAGHCVARASARQVQVTLGDYVINSAVEPLPAYTFGVREIRVHPYFKFTPQADRFDVAVLRLDRPVQYMPHIAPICLPDKGQDFLGQYGWAAGWGALQAGSRLRPKTLQAVDVPVIDNRLCERWHKSNGINVVIYDEMMCSGYRGGGKDSCQGDSGGPLMMEKTGRWFLIGIVSAGYSCAQRGQPGIYHRVSHTVDWISHIINSNG